MERYLFNEGGRIIRIVEREQVRCRLIAYKLYQKYASIGSRSADAQGGRQGAQDAA